MTEIDITRLITAAKREASMRRAVYSRRVAEQKMTRDEADAGITDMEQIAVVLAAIKDDHPALPTLVKHDWIIPAPEATQPELF